MNIDLSTIPDAPKNTIDLSAIPDEEPEASWDEVEKTVARNIPANLAAGATGALALGIESTENIPSGLFPAVELLKRLKEPVQYAAKYWSEKAQKNTEELNLKPGSAKSYATMVQESIGQQAPLIAGGLLTGGTGFILPAMGVLTAGQKKAEFLSKGLEGGNLNAITQGIIEAATEKIPLGQWLKPGTKFMKRLLTATATEIPGEQIATITQGALDKIALNPEISWDEFTETLPSQMKDTLIVTIAQSLIMGVPIHGGAKYLENKQKVKDQLTTQFEVPEAEADKAIETAEQNIRELEQPTPEEAAGLREVMGDNPEAEIEKVKNAAILSQELNIDPGIAYEYQDEIIKELENKIATESPLMVGEPEEAQKQPGEKVYHGGAGVDELNAKFSVLTPEEKRTLPSSNVGLTGLSMTTDKGIALEYSKNIGGTDKVFEANINPQAKIYEVDTQGAGIDDFLTDDQINKIKEQGFDAIRDTSKDGEKEFRVLTEKALVTNTEKAGGIPGETGLRAVGLETIKPAEIVTNEKQLLKFRLSSEARGAKAGYREGRSIARAETIAKFQGQKLTAEEAKKSVVNYLNESLEPKDRGKFLTTVRDAKTPEQAARAFSRIDRYAEQQEVKRAITTLKKTADKFSESKAISIDYRNKINDVLSQYELSGHRDETIAKLKATQDYLNKAKASGEDVEMPQRVLNKLQILSRIPKEELTLNQVQGLQNEIELMGKLGKTKWKSKQARYEAEKQHRKDSLLATVSPINSNIAPQVPIGEEPHEWTNRYIALRNYLQKTRIGLTPIDALADITGMEQMKADLDLNYGNYLTYNDETINQWYELTKDFTESNFERIGAVAAARQEGGLERLVNTGIGEKEISSIKLTPEEEKAYDFVREKFEKEYPSIKKYAMDVYNEDVGAVDNYVSFMSDYEAMSDLEIYDRFGQRGEEATGIRTKTVEQGFTKERAKVSKIKLELNIDKIFRRHMDDVAYMLTMGKDVKQYFEIVNSPEMKEKLGDTGTLAWLQWLDLMARKGGTEGAKRIAILDMARKNIGAGILGFRLSSILIQTTSFADSVATIGAEWSTKGAGSIATSKEWRDFIMDNFPEIKKAVGDDVAFREFGDGMFGKLTRKSMKPLQILDGIMRSVAAAGAYQKLASDLGIEVDLKNPNKGLIQETTKLMRYSQGSSFFKDQPLAFTAGYGLTDNRSVNKTILTFQSFMLNRWSNIVRQIWRLGIKEKDYKKAAFSFFWLAIFASAMEEGIRRGTRGLINLITGDDQEEESFAKNSALNVVQSVPLVGQLVSSLTYSSNPVPVINAMEEGLEGVASAVKGKETKTKLRGAVRAAGAVGSLAGVPGASQAAQIIRKSID